MAFQNVRVCDFAEVETGHPCRKLADSACVLCHKDGCDDHLSYAFAVAVITTQLTHGRKCSLCGKQSCMDHKAIPAVHVQHSLQLCGPCCKYINSLNDWRQGPRPSSTGLHAIVTKAHTDVVEDIRVQWATAALLDQQGGVK